MHYTALTTAGAVLLNKALQETCETVQSCLSEDIGQGRWEGRNRELRGWGLNKKCEENTDGKTKRGENIKGSDMCESCQTRQRRELSKAARRENGCASQQKKQSEMKETATHSVRATLGIYLSAMITSNRHCELGAKTSRYRLLRGVTDKDH